MKHFIKCAAAALALMMAFSMAACGNNDNKESGKTETTAAATQDEATKDEATKDSADSALKGVFDAFVKGKSYATYKEMYPNTQFEEALDGAVVTVKLTGTDGVDGTYTFPAKDGYLCCEVKPNDYVTAGLFNALANSVGEYYGVDAQLFAAYINGTALNGVDTKTFASVINDDGSGSMKVYYVEKPDMKELDDLYINEKTLSVFGENANNFIQSIGKVCVNGIMDHEHNAIRFVIGEYGDKNTEPTYRSIIEIVKYFKPAGYEDFVKEYTALGDASTDKYTVNADATAYMQENGIEKPDGYHFMFVTLGASAAETTAADVE